MKILPIIIFLFFPSSVFATTDADTKRIEGQSEIEEVQDQLEESWVAKLTEIKRRLVGLSISTRIARSESDFSGYIAAANDRIDQSISNSCISTAAKDWDSLIKKQTICEQAFSQSEELLSSIEDLLGTKRTE